MAFNVPNGNMNYGYGIPTGTGYQYGGIDPNAQTRVENALSEEEINRLIQKENVFSLAITETENLRAICTHRFKDGRDSLQENPATGGVRCAICGYEFLPVDPATSPEDIQSAVNTVTDVLQTIKLLYLDMPKEVAREYFQIIALNDKIPELFNHAVKDYARHERFIPGSQYNNKAASIMSIYNMITGGAPMQYQYDQFGNPIQPGFNQNSMFANGNPVYGGDPNMQYAGTNGFAYTPQTTGYQYQAGMATPQAPMMNPPQQAAPVTSAAPVNDGAKTEVTQTFKA